MTGWPPERVDMQTLVARLGGTAAAMPRRIAIQQGARRINYRALRDAALRFAAGLRARGVQAGDRVGLALPNGIEAAVAWYGTWRAGAVVVPLNAQARERDFTAWLRHGGVKLLLHAHGHADAAQAAGITGVQTLVLGPEPDPAGMFADMGTSAEADLPMPDATALAAILYTSGTTGAPKGVALSHRNLAVNTASILGYLRLGAE
ncbi:MAG: acyl--CoA ligase, partial [Gammaproteobacteria bacterium]|nr:acyl--CoA ligase [Gammaproteobacteria bacterium]